MGVIRVEKTKNYTVMSNYHFKDRKISWKAKGLLSTMLSLPEEWDYSIKGLEAMATDGNKAVRSGLKELEENGYLTRVAIRDKKGIIRDWDYTIYENPLENPNWSKEFAEVLNPDVRKGQVDTPEVQKAHVDEGHVENAHVENDIQLNTNQLTTKDINSLNNKDKLKDTDIDILITNEKIELLPETQMLITKGYITKEDPQLGEYNRTIELALMDYRQDQVYRVIDYILKNIDGEVINKLAYFTTSLYRNLEKVEHRENNYRTVEAPFYNWLLN